MDDFLEKVIILLKKVNLKKSSSILQDEKKKVNYSKNTDYLEDIKESLNDIFKNSFITSKKSKSRNSSFYRSPPLKNILHKSKSNAFFHNFDLLKKKNDIKKNFSYKGKNLNTFIFKPEKTPMNSEERAPFFSELKNSEKIIGGSKGKIIEGSKEMFETSEFQENNDELVKNKGGTIGSFGNSENNEELKKNKGGSKRIFVKNEQKLENGKFINYSIGDSNIIKKKMEDYNTNNFSFCEMRENSEESEIKMKFKNSNILNNSFGSFNLESEKNIEKENDIIISEKFQNENFFPYFNEESIEIYTVDKKKINLFKDFLKRKKSYLFKKKEKFVEKKIKKTNNKNFEKYSDKFRIYLKIYVEKKITNIIRDKFVIKDLICESTFSYIYNCYKKRDKEKKFIAKKIKNEKIFFDQSIFEIYILNYLKKKGNPQKNNFLEIIEYFYYNHNLYIITEKLGDSLYKKYIKEKNEKINNFEIQKIIKDILTALKFLKNNGIIHCDLKPENILTKKIEENPKISKNEKIQEKKKNQILQKIKKEIFRKKKIDEKITIIDFGSAIFIEDTDQHYTLQTLPYRAPEIILKTNYSYQIDIFSLGCILYELITKKVLFNYSSEKKNFVKILAINKIFKFSCFENFGSFFFFENEIPVLRNEANFDKNKEHFIIPKFSFNIENEIFDICGDNDLVDFVMRCLKLDPNERLTVEEGLKHFFVKKEFN